MKMSAEWNNINKVVLYGMGLVADRFIDKIIRDFDVPFIIDKKKAGENYKDINIVTLETVVDQIKQSEYKIVVMTSRKVYEDIKTVLEGNNFEEYKDFCHVEKFAIEWYWQNKQQINIVQVNTAITTSCTLNCTNCNMFMPYYKNKTTYGFDEMKGDIDILMKNIDYLFCYMLLGGEPFLNPDLGKIIEYTRGKYAEKIGKISVTTNGTVLPCKETLEVLKKNNVRVVISNYTAAVDYTKKYEMFIQTLEEWGIAYTVNITLEWRDFGFPVKPFNWGSAENVAAHMISCSPLFHGLNDGKFYYCHVIWSAEKANLYKVSEHDYIDLRKLDSSSIEDKRRLSEYSMGIWEKKYLDFCKVCGGCGDDNQNYVQAGAQMKRNI